MIRAANIDVIQFTLVKAWKAMGSILILTCAANTNVIQSTLVKV